MSAYALPGSFSFPTNNNNNNNNNNKKNDIPSTKGRLTTTVTKSLTKDSNGELCIKIPFASVDSLRLVQSLIGTSSSPKSASSQKTKTPTVQETTNAEAMKEELHNDDNDDDDDDIDNHYDVECYNDENDYYDYSETFSSPSCRTCTNNNSSSRQHENNESHNQHEQDAIHFHLSINFYGRTYTAKRTLPSFIQLRNDLIKELSYASTTASQITQNKYSKSSRNYRPYPSKSMNAHAINHDDRVDLIPELPLEGNPISTNSCSIKDSNHNNTTTTTSFQMAAGRGFSRLHAACAAYCPAFESWLRHVADLVPGSPTLSQFLWEPLNAYVSSSSSLNTTNTNATGQHATNLNGNIITRREQTNKSRRRSTLSSIDEINAEEEEEEDENEEDS